MVAAPTFDYIVIPPADGAQEYRDKAETVVNELNISLFVRDALRNYLLYGEYVKILQTVKVNGQEKIMLKPLKHKYVRFDGTVVLA